MSNPANLRFHAWHKREEAFTPLGWRAHEDLTFVVMDKESGGRRLYE
jgi:hypothetical protein